MNCPLCGSRVTYQGLASLECAGETCPNRGRVSAAPPFSTLDSICASLVSAGFEVCVPRIVSLYESVVGQPDFGQRDLGVINRAGLECNVYHYPGRGWSVWISDFSGVLWRWPTP